MHYRGLTDVTLVIYEVFIPARRNPLRSPFATIIIWDAVSMKRHLRLRVQASRRYPVTIRINQVTNDNADCTMSWDLGRRKLNNTALTRFVREIPARHYMMMLRWSLAHRVILVMICIVTFLSTFGLYRLV